MSYELFVFVTAFHFISNLHHLADEPPTPLSFGPIITAVTATVVPTDSPTATSHTHTQATLLLNLSLTLQNAQGTSNSDSHMIQ